MNINQSKNLARYHKYTRLELYEILKEALEKEKPEYWNKPNGVNTLFTNGWYFNWCVKLIKYQKGINDNSTPDEIIVARVLQTFGKYSKHQIPKKKKYVPEFINHEEPKLII